MENEGGNDSICKSELLVKQTLEQLGLLAEKLQRLYRMGEWLAVTNIKH